MLLANENSFQFSVMVLVRGDDEILIALHSRSRCIPGHDSLLEDCFRRNKTTNLNRIKEVIYRLGKQGSNQCYMYFA